MCILIDEYRHNDGRTEENNSVIELISIPLIVAPF
jgi:hypothetical protein